MFSIIGKKSQKEYTKALDSLYNDLQPIHAPFLNSKIRKAMFVAQLAHETGQFRWLKELGGKSYFDKYEGRLDLGNTQEGDGYKYRGRGLIMITGRYNYEKYGKLLNINLLEAPDKALLPDVALLIAFKYWEINKLASLEDNVKKVTRKINGGYNGLAERTQFFNLLTKN